MFVKYNVGLKVNVWFDSESEFHFRVNAKNHEPASLNIDEVEELIKALKILVQNFKDEFY